ncbi:MAG TPA: NAD-dependent epimerase/dehydratase family protein [Anaerolineales bacterium]|nr:NAD-dependent epimerase/dehydratase family protein [Anaerolineales bacterium]
MDPQKVQKVMISLGNSILDAVRTMDLAQCGITLIVDSSNHLLGVFTDGDARRAILEGKDLDTPLEGLITRDPIVLRDNASSEEIAAFLQSERLRKFRSILIPVIDENGRPLNILHSSELNNPNASPERPPSDQRPVHVLLIGGAGYIGSVLTRLLLADNYRVTILDNFLYGTESIEGIMGHPLLDVIKGDTRHIDDVVPLIRGAQAVIHMAELVGDPLCARDIQTTFEINYLATASIARTCAYLQVNRFIYISSCSVYGASYNPDEYLNEDSPLLPVSLYAKTKIGAEHAIQEMRTKTFAPCILRLGTVFGLSFRPRFDLVVNTLTAKAIQEHQIEIFGGDQWRPHVHVKDVTNAIQMTLQAPIEAIQDQIFNIVGSNHRINEIGQMVADQIPETKINLADRVVDKRNYRVSNQRIQEQLGFRPEFHVADGIREISNAFQSGIVADYRNPQYHNLNVTTQSVIRKPHIWDEHA